MSSTHLPRITVLKHDILDIEDELRCPDLHVEDRESLKHELWIAKRRLRRAIKEKEQRDKTD